MIRSNIPGAILTVAIWGGALCLFIVGLWQEWRR